VDPLSSVNMPLPSDKKFASWLIWSCHNRLPQTLIPRAVKIKNPKKYSNSTLASPGSTKSNVSISTFKVLAFLISLKTLRILRVLITVVIDFKLKDDEVKSKIIPKSVDITTKKSKQFHESLN